MSIVYVVSLVFVTWRAIIYFVEGRPIATIAASLVGLVFAGGIYAEYRQSHPAETLSPDDRALQAGTVTADPPAEEFAPPVPDSDSAAGDWGSDSAAPPGWNDESEDGLWAEDGAM